MDMNLSDPGKGPPGKKTDAPAAAPAATVQFGNDESSASTPTASPVAASAATSSAAGEDVPTLGVVPASAIKPTGPSGSGLTVTQTITAQGTSIQQSKCRRALPADRGTNAMGQIIEFQYELQVLSGIDPANATDFVEHALHDSLVERFLDCVYDRTQEAVPLPFEMVSLSTAPRDVLKDKCATDEGVSGTDCYLIQAGFTAELFYWRDNTRIRRLQPGQAPTQTLILDTRVVDVFGPFLDSTLKESGWTGAQGEISSMQFRGFSNMQSDGAQTYGGQDAKETGVAAINRDDPIAEPSDGPKLPMVASSLAVVIAAVALVAVLVLGVQRRRNDEKAKLRRLEEEEEMQSHKYDNEEPEVDDESVNAIEREREREKERAQLREREKERLKDREKQKERERQKEKERQKEERRKREQEQELRKHQQEQKQAQKRKPRHKRDVYTMELEDMEDPAVLEARRVIVVDDQSSVGDAPRLVEYSNRFSKFRPAQTTPPTFVGASEAFEMSLMDSRQYEADDTVDL